MPNTAQTWLEDFIANTTQSGDQGNPVITQLRNGNILVSWDDHLAQDVYGQIFDPTGTPVGSEIRLNYAYFFNDEGTHSVDAVPTGGFISVYTHTVGGKTSIRMDRFDNDGNPVASQTNIAVATSGSGSYFNPEMAIASGTSILVAYEAEDPANSADHDIMGRIYNPNTDSLGPEFLILGSAEEITNPDIAVLDNGNYVMAAENVTAAGGESILVSVLDAAGNTIYSPRIVAGTHNSGTSDGSPTVTSLSNGKFVVAWESSEGGDVDIKFLIHEANGNPIGSAQLVNSTGSADNYTGVDITTLDDGGFAISYTDSDTENVHVQRYDADGNEVGNVHTVNAESSGETTIYQLEDGRIVLSWEGLGAGTSGDDVHVEIIDYRDDITAVSYGIIGTVQDDTIIVPSFEENIFGWDGDDTILMQADGVYTGTYDGGTGNDTLLLDDPGTFDLSGATLTGIEKIEFAEMSLSSKRIIVDSDQLTPMVINGNTGGSDFLIIEINGYISGGFSFLIFEDWTAGQDIIHFVNADDKSSDFRATMHNDIITMGSGKDILDGRAGNDYINGGTGHDTISGGDGNDILIGGGGFDTLDGGAGIDKADYTYTSFDLTVDLVQGIAHVTGLFSDEETLTQIENIVMGGGDDTVIGNAVKNVLAGGGGHDNLQGRGGDDTLNGDAGNDMLVGHSGNDFLYGGDGADILEGNSGNDAIYGGDDVDTINAGGGNDIVNGGDGDDDIAGATGNDTINGGAGDDYIHGGNQQDTLSGSTGNDTIEGGAGNDFIYGGGDDDMLIGNSGADTLYGGNGHDTLEGSSGGDDLFGGSGADVLNGGGGNDILTGGVGADDFVFTTAFGTDRIKDFQNGIDDIDFSGHSAFNDFAGVLAAASQVGANVRIDLNANNTLVIENFDLADMDATDFVF